MTVVTESKVLSNSTLILRRFRENDLADLYALTSSLEVMAFLGGAKDQTQTRALLKQLIVPGNSEDMYAMVYRPTMEFAGYAGFIECTSEHPEIQVAVLPKFQRKGLARSAFDLCLSYANDVLNKTQISILINPDHKIAKKVVGKVGFKFKKMHVQNGRTRELYTYGS